jgi:hypothetical protein
MSYIPLATVTLGGSDADIVFSNIPATFKDLVIVVIGSSNQVGSPSLQLNGDAGSNYDNVRLYDNGSSALSQSFNATYASIGIMNTSSTVTIANIMDYAATDKHKTILARGGTTGNTTRTEISRWANTAAVTSVKVCFDGSALYSTGTVMSLYGVA